MLDRIPLHDDYPNIKNHYVGDYDDQWVLKIFRRFSYSSYYSKETALYITLARLRDDYTYYTYMRPSKTLVMRWYMTIEGFDDADDFTIFDNQLTLWE